MSDGNLFWSIIFLIYRNSKTSYKTSAWLHNNPRRPSESEETNESTSSRILLFKSLSSRGKLIDRIDRCHFPRRIFRVRCREKLLNEAAPHERKVETLQWVKERRRLSLPLDVSSSRERPPPESRPFFSFSFCVFPSPPWEYLSAYDYARLFRPTGRCVYGKILMNASPKLIHLTWTWTRDPRYNARVTISRLYLV